MSRDYPDLKEVPAWIKMMEGTNVFGQKEKNPVWLTGLAQFVRAVVKKMCKDYMFINKDELCDFIKLIFDERIRLAMREMEQDKQSARQWSPDLARRRGKGVKEKKVADRYRDFRDRGFPCGRVDCEYYEGGDQEAQCCYGEDGAGDPMAMTCRGYVPDPILASPSLTASSSPDLAERQQGVMDAVAGGASVVYPARHIGEHPRPDLAEREAEEAAAEMVNPFHRSPDLAERLAKWLYDMRDESMSRVGSPGFKWPWASTELERDFPKQGVYFRAKAKELLAALPATNPIDTKTPEQDEKLAERLAREAAAAAAVGWLESGFKEGRNGIEPVKHITSVLLPYFREAVRGDRDA